jgi:hypothetical protein
LGRIGFSSILAMVTSPRMSTWSGTIASQSSGWPPFDWTGVADSAGRSCAKIDRLVNVHAEDLLEAWNAYFGR